MLKIWNPDQFCLRMFITFSPLHTLLLAFRSHGNIVRDCLLCLFLSAQMYILVKLFTQQVHDKQMIFSETFEEYEQKAVRPKLSVVRRDVAVGTDGSVDISVTPLNRHFATHDIRPSSLSSSPLFGTPKFQSHVPYAAASPARQNFGSPAANARSRTTQSASTGCGSYSVAPTVSNYESPNPATPGQSTRPGSSRGRFVNSPATGRMRFRGET